jgi:type I restriction enzyme R subunit
MTEEDARKRTLGLSEEEIAFYDSIAWLRDSLYDEPFLADLVKDIVKSVKANLKVDWTKAHREDVQAGVRSAVRRVLTRRKVDRSQFDRILGDVMVQAVALYERILA